MPKDSETVPQDSETVPQESKTVPKDSESVLIDSESTPRDTESVPKESESAPNDSVPASHDSNSGPKDDAPEVSQEPTEAKVPVAEETVSPPAIDVEKPGENKSGETFVEEQRVDTKMELEVEYNEPSIKMEVDVKEEPVEVTPPKCNISAGEIKEEYCSSQVNEVKDEHGSSEYHPGSVPVASYPSFYVGNDVCNEVEIGASEEVAVSSPDDHSDYDDEVKCEKVEIKENTDEKTSIIKNEPLRESNKTSKSETTSKNAVAADSKRERIKVLPPKTTAVADTSTTTSISSRYVKKFPQLMLETTILIHGSDRSC